MTPVVTAETTTEAVFPTATIETCIREFLAREAEMQQNLHGISQSTGGSGSAVGPKPFIDSLVVVEILLEVEDVVPFELSESLVRPGGYECVDDVLQHLMPELERRWRKYYGEK